MSEGTDSSWLSDAQVRRATGRFFTPRQFVRKAHELVVEVIGPRWWKRNFRLWDMAAGTGNLAGTLPPEALPAVYLSTLHEEDVARCRQRFPGAAAFQYDYLNDDVGLLAGKSEKADGLAKLPPELRADLANPEIKWIILLNPPFATSQKAGCSGGSKANVSDTKIRPLMHAQGLGAASRELFAQFLFRMRREFAGRAAHLGLFSTLKYVNANNDQGFRDQVFHFRFEGGFVFSSANFSGTQPANPFPVGFLMWNLAERKRIADQKIEVAVMDDHAVQTGRKIFASAHRERFLSRWIERPATSMRFPPLGSAIAVKGGNRDVRDRIAPGFLASLMCKGNDVQNHNNVALLSGPYVSAGALSVTPENFAKAMVVHAVRRNVRKTWLNDRDQFLMPKSAPGAAFIRQCVVWSLFADSNQTASLRNVSHKGAVHQIVNHFHPFRASVVAGWEVSDSSIARSLEADREDRFMAGWLAGQEPDADGAALLALGGEVYRLFYRRLRDLPTSAFKIEHWDAGWWQIKRSLAEAGLAKEHFAEIERLKKRVGEGILAEAVNLGMISAV
jgi:hypothetical protein